MVLTITPEDVHIVLEKLKNIPKAPKPQLVGIHYKIFHQNHYKNHQNCKNYHNVCKCDNQVRLATWNSVLTACWKMLNRKYDQNQVFVVIVIIIVIVTITIVIIIIIVIIIVMITIIRSLHIIAHYHYRNLQYLC